MASGDTLLIYGPANNEASTQPPQFDTRNYHLVLDFTASSSEPEYAIFKGVLPRNYGNSGVTVNLHYSMSSATTGDVVWDCAFERVSDSQQDIDSDGFAADNSTTVTVPPTNGHVDIVGITFTNGADMDSVAAGEGFRLRIKRDTSVAADDATGDAELWGFEIKET